MLPPALFLLFVAFTVPSSILFLVYPVFFSRLLVGFVCHVALVIDFEIVRANCEDSDYTQNKASRSLFERSIVGSYHQVSAKDLDAYLDEFEWRFNQRENPYLFCDTLIRLVRSPKDGI